MLQIPLYAATRSMVMLCVLVVFRAIICISLIQRQDDCNREPVDFLAVAPYASCRLAFIYTGPSESVLNADFVRLFLVRHIKFDIDVLVFRWIELSEREQILVLMPFPTFVPI